MILRRIFSITYSAVISLTILNTYSCFYYRSQGKETIEFYYRGVGSNNGYTTYLDNLKITNYSDQSITASYLFDFATKYIDTIHADKPVSVVTFIGETSFRKLPKPTEDYFNVERNQSLIQFGFSNASEEKSSSPKARLQTMTVWKDGKHKTYYYDVPTKKRIIDSILNSKEPFDNGF